MLYIYYTSACSNQCSLTGGGVRCVHSSQECYILYTLACSDVPSLGVVYGVFIAHKNVYIYYTSACSNAPSPGVVYCVFIAHKNVIYIILQHVPMLPHWGRCTVCSQLTRMLYILYFSMFQCSLTGGGVRCVHSSQECYIYYTSACSNQCSLTGGGVRCVHSSQECYIYYTLACSDVPSLGVVYGVFIAHKNVIIYYTSACSNAPSPGVVYGVFIAHKNVIYTLYFSMFQCSLTGGGVRCAHSSQECYVYYTSACSNVPSLGVVYGCVHDSPVC